MNSKDEKNRIDNNIQEKIIFPFPKIEITKAAKKDDDKTAIEMKRQGNWTNFGKKEICQIYDELGIERNIEIVKDKINRRVFLFLFSQKKIKAIIKIIIKGEF